MLDLKKIEVAIKQISVEKKISKERLISIIESAIKTAYKKDHGNKDEEVNVKLDFQTYNIEISVEKTVVTEVKNPALEISFDDLGDDAEGFEEGDVIELDVTDNINGDDNGESFGRIASQAARQVIIQKIGETEKEKIYDLFKGKEGEVLSMRVEIIEKGKVILDYNGNQVVLPKREQINRDSYKAEDRVYIYVAEVNNDEKAGPRVTLSRRSAGLVSGLFSVFVPEVSEGSITIDRIVREPGVKTKLLVSTDYEEIDPIGTLIGKKGMRVKTVMDELRGEKIDIIADNGSLEAIIKSSLTPASILNVEVDEENESAQVYLLPSERAKAIGKGGVNIKLASELTGYKISLQEVVDEMVEEVVEGAE